MKKYIADFEKSKEDFFARDDNKAIKKALAKEKDFGKCNLIYCENEFFRNTFDQVWISR